MGDWLQIDNFPSLVIVLVWELKPCFEFKFQMQSLLIMGKKRWKAHIIGKLAKNFDNNLQNSQLERAKTSNVWKTEAYGSQNHDPSKLGNNLRTNFQKDNMVCAVCGGGCKGQEQNDACCRNRHILSQWYFL